MSRRVLIKACLLLAVTSHVQAQYIDFFQNFNSFLQPFTTNKPRNDATKRPVTKHRQTTKQKIQDVIFFETDDFLKQRENAKTLNPFIIQTTTTKPRRKNTKSSTTSHSYKTTSKPNKPDNSNKIVNNNRNFNYDIVRSVSDDNHANNVDGQTNDIARRIDNYNNDGYDTYNLNSETARPNYELNYNNNRQTTQRTTTTTNYYNPETTQKVDYYGRQTSNIFDNGRTTQRTTMRQSSNPLFNRPGVKPAVVDENRPPITNRPVTESHVYDHQFESGIYEPFTRPPVFARPVNTRSPFETERPISTGVARPIASKPASNDDTEVDIEIGPDEDDMSDAEKRRLYDICEQKCGEYKSMRTKKLVALPLAGGPSAVEVNVSSCAPDTAPLIIGGQLARIETFPHMALVGWKNLQSGGYAWKCGGSLVSEQYVLTAGHCTYHDKDYNVVSGPPTAVQLGSSIYNDHTATVVQVSLVVRHPKYKLRRSYHDVALIKMAVEVSFSNTIMPACLGVPPSVGEPIVATGWGKTEFGGDSSIQLRSVSIPVWDMNDCREIWGTSLKLPNGPMADSQICAGERKGAKDTCQGDSGGPAQVRDACTWRVVAVTSVGRSCGAPETPALYATLPRAFIAKQVFTSNKPGRDGNNQYGNAGNNGNNNWNSGNNNRSNFQSDVTNTRPQNINGQSYSSAGNTANNNQNYGNKQVNTGDTGAYNNNGNNNWNVNNNRHNGNGYDYNKQVNTGDTGTYNNNGNNNWNVNNNRYNGNGYDYNANNGQTTNSYISQNNFGQNSNYNGNSFGQNQNIRNPSDIRTYDTQVNSYHNNGRTDNRYNNNGYNNYSGSRPLWTR